MHVPLPSIEASPSRVAQVRPGAESRAIEVPAAGGQVGGEPRIVTVAETQVAEEPAFRLSDVAPLDLVGACVLLAFAVLGAWRGLWWQAMRFAGIAGAVLAARAFTPALAPKLSAVLPELDPRLATGLVWLAMFLAGLAVAALVGRLGRRLLEAMQLGLVDRFGGLVAGALTGLVLHAALVAAVLQLAPAEFAQASVSGTRSEALVRALARPVPLIFDGTTTERVRELLAAPPADEDPYGPGDPYASDARARPR